MCHQIISKLVQHSTYFELNEEIVLLVGITVLVGWLYVLNNRKKKLPPGPIGLPIFGYYLFLGENHEKTIDNLAKKYGNVFGLYLGPQYIVFLNDWDAVKDAYSQKATVNRPPIFEKLPFKFGLGGANGEKWVQVRRLSSRAMKDVGLYNTVWEKFVQEEATELVQQIIRKGDRPLDVQMFFRDSFTNNMVTLAFGKRLHAGHPFTKLVSESVDTIMENTPTLGMMNFSITLAILLQKLGLEKENPFFKTFVEFCDFISNTVDEVTQNDDSEKDDSFILRFQEQIETHRKNKGNHLLSENHVKGTVVNLLVGGSEVIRSAIIFALIAMAENQDKQRKVHEELDRVLGEEGSIRWSERFKLPYTYATLTESMRWAPLVTFTALRIASEDTEIQGYHIPKGTFLTTNNYSLHNDPRYWKEPERFIPERFLLEDGRKVNTTPDSFNPFSYGKRMCPGKLMAQMEILQYFTILMQHFKVVPKIGNTVKYGVISGLTNQVTDAELRFIPR